MPCSLLADGTNPWPGPKCRCPGTIRRQTISKHQADSVINPHPVMSPDLRGPPAGPRRPGTMIFKCVELLVQSKNNNSSYWLLHITSALNCKIWLFFLASILCHVRNMMKKYMGENVTKIYISAINENRFFATFMHIVIKTMCMMDLFDIPLCGKNTLIHVFFIIFLGK